MDSSWSDKHHRKGFVALHREFRSSASLRYLPSIVVSDQKYALGVKIFAVGRCRTIDQEKWSWQAVQWFPTICEAAANFGRGEEARIVDKVFYVWIASQLLSFVVDGSPTYKKNDDEDDKPIFFGQKQSSVKWNPKTG